MSIQYVNIGTNPNDGTGDDLRSAFLKVNDNFQLLATIGGETNYGANLGGGSGQVYIGKTNEVLNFRTLASGLGIALVQDGNVIRISSTVVAQPNITNITADSGSYPVSSPNATLSIRGSGSIATQIVGNELTINGNFSLSSDPLPELSSNLNLAGYDITGTGDISHNGFILTDNLTVGRSSGPGNFPSTTLLNGTLTVKSTSTLAGVNATTVNASTSVTAPIFNATGNGFVGSLAGNTTGTHYGNVSIKGLGGPDIVVVNTATNPATITGSHVGTFSGGLTGTIISGGLNLNGEDIFGNGTLSAFSPDSTPPVFASSNYYPDQILPTDIPTITDLGGSAIFTMRQQDFGVSESLRLRATVNNSSNGFPFGTGIAFEAVNTIDPLLPGYDPFNIPTNPEYQLHGFIGVLNYLEYEEYPNYGRDVYSTFVARVRREQTNPDTPYLFDIIKARGDGRITLGDGIEIRNSLIKPYQVINSTGTFEEPCENDLILLTERPDTYVNFYGSYANAQGGGSAVGGYSFPQSIGTPGQVLQVRVPDGINPNNLLEWATPSGGGGGGGGSTTLLGLLDTPNSYLPGDSGKILVIKSDLSGIEFVNSISATLTGNVTGNVTGNASTATALQTTRTINGKDFNGTQNVTLTTADISENTNLYFTEVRARGAISVASGTSLSYVNGSIGILESTTATADSLVKRTGTGGVEVTSLKVSTIEKNTADTAITLNSRLETAAVIASTNAITTTGTVSAGFINLTGTGDQTIASSTKIILSPVTTVDVSGKRITNLPLTVPVDNSDATSKKYVDDQTSSVFTASLQSFPLTGDSGGSLTVTKGSTVTISGSTNINTSTTVNGVQVSLKSSISGITVTGNLPVTGTLTASIAVKAGNINITNNEIQQTVTGNNINLVPGSSGGSVIVTGGDFKLTTNSRLFITGSNIVEVAANSLEVEVTVATPVTFVRTLNWVDDNAALAYAFMNDGTQGQTKTIIMLDRGNYGNALDTRPRYLVLRGKINGASRTVNIAASDPNGSSTFIFLDGFWWRTANVA